MLEWLRNKLRNRQRAIFRFWDGTCIRGVDPMSIFLAIKAHPTYNAETDPPLVDADDKDAYERMVKGCQDVFSIPVFQEVNGIRHGLTGPECISLMVDFTQYVVALKKNTSGNPMTPDATVGTSISGSSSFQNMNEPLASGSTLNASTSAEQAAS